MTPAETEKAATESWLQAEMTWIWLVAERSLRELQAAKLRPAPDHPSIAEIEGVLAARRAARKDGGGVPDEAKLTKAVEEAEAKLATLRAAAPIGRLQRTLQLRPTELRSLLVAMAPHIDAPLADVFALVRGSAARRGVDLALVSQLFRLRRPDRVDLLDVVDPERPLLFWRLIQVMPPESAEGYGSIHYRALQPTFDALSVLCGREALSPTIERLSSLRQYPANLDGLILDEPVRLKLTAIGEAARAGAADGRFLKGPWLLLWGPRGAGKREAAGRLAAFGGCPLFAFNPTRVDRNLLDENLRRAQREALLRGAVLYIGPIPPDLLPDNGKELARRLASYPALIALGVEASQAPRFDLPSAVQEIDFPLPSEPARTSLWELAVPKDVRAADIQLSSLIRSFRLTPGEILDVASEAATIGRGEGRLIGHLDLRVGVERRLRNELRDLARRITAISSWNDLVLPPEDMERVQEFLSRMLYAEKVYNEWGFGGRIVYGKGMIALFSGPPGTGKTMLAGLIANALDLDLYMVDIAQVVSKWVGETEKQLSKIFDLAERAHAVLLFDEADSLFAKRTEVKSSNDRYGNLAVNYLLQRLEQYVGVAVLTTNKDALVDEALQRRLSLHLRLDVPGPPERERLWRTFLPAKAPGAGAFDLRALAHEYELTGGYIKNAAVRAAFLAAAQGSSITMPLLRKAASLEMEDMGRVVARRRDGDETEISTARGFGTTSRSTVRGLCDFFEG